MPKKKKTLKQKLKAEQRRQFPTPDSSSVENSVIENHAQIPTEQTFSLPQSYLDNSHKAKQKTAAMIQNARAQTLSIATHEYKYLGRDLAKTLFLTGSIIIVELVLRFIFERG